MKKIRFIIFITIAIFFILNFRVDADEEWYVHRYAVICKDGGKECQQVADLLEDYVDNLGTECFKNDEYDTKEEKKRRASVELKDFVNKIKYPGTRERYMDMISFCYKNKEISFESMLYKSRCPGDKTNLIGIELSGFGFNEENKLNQEAMKEFSKKIKKKGIGIIGEKTATWWGKNSEDFFSLRCF